MHAANQVLKASAQIQLKYGYEIRAADICWGPQADKCLQLLLETMDVAQRRASIRSNPTQMQVRKSARILDCERGRVRF
jgi:hypothetical protein